MTTIFSYETFDTETGRLVVAPIKRTGEAIVFIGGRLIKETAEVVADEWTGRRGDYPPCRIPDAVHRDKWYDPHALPSDRARRVDI